MAEIHPFRGVHYNESLLQDWSAVICPIYDIISPQLQPELYRRSLYNFVRLEFGQELPQDTASDNKYTRSAATLEQWLKQGILEVAPAPAIYLHDQYFRHQGREYKRRSLIARVRVEEWDKRVIRPHEGTMAEPKSDRLSLLRTLRANTSSILALFEDPGQRIAKLLAALPSSPPLLNLRDVAGESHVVWALTEPEIVNPISLSLAQQPLYIADGHHRYESALTYQRERHAEASATSRDEAFNFVMMTLVDLADPGLIILPPHRLMRGIAPPILNGLLAKLKTLFTIEELPLTLPGVWQQIDESPRATDEIRLILVGLSPERLCVLRLRHPEAVSQMMPHFHSELYQKLEVSIVDHIILEKLLGLSQDKEQSFLAYSYDRADAVNRVSVREYQLALLLSPVKATTVKAIADAGDKMPRKSTYFYPKPPAGLIFNRLV